MYTVFSPGGKDCMGVKRDSQIVAVFDTVGNGAVFDEDGATRFVLEKNFAGIFNYCRSRHLPFKFPIVSAGCRTTRLEEFGGIIRQEYR